MAVRLVCVLGAGPMPDRRAVPARTWRVRISLNQMLTLARRAGAPRLPLWLAAALTAADLGIMGGEGNSAAAAFRGTQIADA